MSDLVLVSVGGFCVPALPSYGVPLRGGDLFTVSYEVEGRLRRWWWKRTGWSTEWKVEYEYVPLVDALPMFTASRGGMSYP